MFKTIFWSFMVAVSLGLPAFGCNTGLLDSEAETLNFNISSGAKVTASTVRDSLRFLQNVEAVDHKYREAEQFKELDRSLSKEIPTSHFLSFLTVCREIYEAENNLQSRAALHMLLERVGKKARSQHSLEQRHEALKEQTRQSQDFDLAAMVDSFTNMDKSPIGVHNPMTSVH